MAIELKHATLSTAGPYTPTGELGPDEWNAGHNLTMATARLLGRTTASAGAVEEISTGGGLTLSGGVLSSSSAESFIASGTIAAAGLVVSLNANGTVSAVSGAASSAGTEVVFESATTNEISAVYDSTNGKVVIAYQDAGNSNYGTAIVGTVSGTSISFGTPVVFESASTYFPSICFDSANGKVVIAYEDAGNLNYGTAIVGTVSGTSISFGTAVVFESATTEYLSAVYDSTNGKVVIAYQDAGNSNYGTAIVGTVSGTSISFGTAVVFRSASAIFIAAAYDSTNGKIVIAYKNSADLTGEAIVGTVSGTSISFGTAIRFCDENMSYTAICFDSANGKVVVVYTINAESAGAARVGTVLGTSISFGAPVVFAGYTTYLSSVYDPSQGKVVIAWEGYYETVFYGGSIAGQVSRNSIVFEEELVFDSSDAYYASLAYDSTNGKVVIAYSDSGNSNYGTAVVYTTSTTNRLRTLGIAQSSATNTNPVKIKLPNQVDANQTGLTAGSSYYVATGGGAISTTNTGTLVGKAISATELLITNWSQ